MRARERERERWMRYDMHARRADRSMEYTYVQLILVNRHITFWKGCENFVLCYRQNLAGQNLTLISPDAADFVGI